MRRVIVISDGQTGASRGAVDAAIRLALDYEGWAPAGKHAADGDIPAIYASKLRESTATDMGMVRRINAQDSHGTLVFSPAFALVGVAAYMDKITERMGCAFLHVAVPVGGRLRDEVVLEVQEWIRENELARIYVTGPGESESPGMQRTVAAAMERVLEPFAADELRHVTAAVNLMQQIIDQPT